MQSLERNHLGGLEATVPAVSWGWERGLLPSSRRDYAMILPALDRAHRGVLPQSL